MNPAIKYTAWTAQRRAAFSEQVAALEVPREQRISRPDPETPTTGCCWKPRSRPCSVRRWDSGEWTWVTARHVVIRTPDEAA